jgi:hypothetical protein
MKLAVPVSRPYHGPRSQCSERISGYGDVQSLMVTKGGVLVLSSRQRSPRLISSLACTFHLGQLPLFTTLGISTWANYDGDGRHERIRCCSGLSWNRFRAFGEACDVSSEASAASVCPH